MYSSLSVCWLVILKLFRGFLSLILDNTSLYRFDWMLRVMIYKVKQWLTTCRFLRDFTSALLGDDTLRIATILSILSANRSQYIWGVLLKNVDFWSWTIDLRNCLTSFKIQLSLMPLSVSLKLSLSFVLTSEFWEHIFNLDIGLTIFVCLVCCTLDALLFDFLTWLMDVIYIQTICI